MEKKKKINKRIRKAAKKKTRQNYRTVTTTKREYIQPLYPSTINRTRGQMVDRSYLQFIVNYTDRSSTLITWILVSQTVIFGSVT